MQMKRQERDPTKRRKLENKRTVRKRCPQSDKIVAPQDHRKRTKCCGGGRIFKDQENIIRNET